MKDTGPMEFNLTHLHFRKSCREPPIILTPGCVQCPEYRACKHAWRISEQLEDF